MPEMRLNHFHFNPFRLGFPLFFVPRDYCQRYRKARLCDKVGHGWREVNNKLNVSPTPSAEY
jgi:hypothetical protein